jgi:hypothetical protein
VTEATADLEDRIVATLVNMGREVQSLFTLVHTQVALTNSLLQYVLTCTAEPPEDVLPAARARARLIDTQGSFAWPPGGRNAKQSDSGAGARKWQAGVREPRRSVEACRRVRCIWYAIARRARTQRPEGSFASGNT